MDEELFYSNEVDNTEPPAYNPPQESEDYENYE